MPDEKDPHSPAQRPEERSDAPRPTVMRPPAGNAGSPADEARGARPRPTVVRAKTSESGAPPEANSKPKTAEVAAPTVIAGVERKRLAVTLDDLQKLSPDTESTVRARALQLLHAYVEETATDRTAVMWGYEIQQEYADLVSRTLSLSQTGVLKRVTGYLSRMLEILRTIDLASVAGLAGQTRTFQKFVKRMTKKIDTPEELEAARVELDQLVKLMSAAMRELLDLKDKLEQYSSRIDAIGFEVEASALAAQFLATYPRAKDQELSQRFEERSMSLTQTALQIRGSVSMRESEIEQPLRLIGAIQNVALVTLPAWLGSIASLTTLAQGRKPTPTEAGELAYQLQEILERLET
jgi:hypothetical protein